MKLLRLIAVYLFDFTRANLELARQLVTPGLRIDPQVIEIDTKVESPAEILALANLITFTPGTLTLDIQPGKKLRVHVLAEAPETARAIRERLEKPLLEVTRKSS